MKNERSVDVPAGAEPITAVCWSPVRDGAPTPLVLAGHGGGGHKADGFVTALRERLIPRGIAVAAIDALGHGERAVAEPAPDDVIRVISEPRNYEQMTADWAATLDLLLASGDFDAGAVAYAGLSGGSLFGLPVVANDQRIRAAVLGACGYEGAPLLGDAPRTFAPLLRDAARGIERPVLFLVQADDDFFPPDGGRALFADIASNDKRLIESPGTHVEVPPAALDEASRWLAGRLLA